MRKRGASDIICFGKSVCRFGKGRTARRRLVGLDEAIKESDGETAAAIRKEFERGSVKLKQKEAGLRDYCRKNNLLYDSSRMQVAYGSGTTKGFGRSVSQKAVWANRKAGLNSVADSGIINKKGSVQTKLSASSSVENPMSAKKYARMKIELERIGCSVIAVTSGDDLAYLSYLGAEAIADEYGIMHIGNTPSASAFFEEIIHWQQIRKYGAVESTDFIERAAREVAANEKLLRCGKAYGFDATDFEDIKRNLAVWHVEFKNRAGTSYENSGINRDV